MSSNSMRGKAALGMSAILNKEFFATDDDGERSNRCGVKFLTNFKSTHKYW